MTTKSLATIGIALSLSLLGFSISAATLEEAQQMAQDGRTPEAIEALQEIVTAQPKNAEAQILLGDCLWAVGRNTEALAAYSSAKAAGSREGTLALAKAAALQYRLDDADNLLAAYRASLKKGRKVLAQDASGDLPDRIQRTRSMLDRVQRIEVIDSLVVDRDNFFRAYRLSPESGSLMSAEVLPNDFPASEPTVVFTPENRARLIWALPDTAGVAHLASSIELFGGEWDEPTLLGDILNEGGDANYPFLMPDGITLYYASDGDDSLGGLDIFISRSDDEGNFLMPQNLGMPYNSPYDDYMLAIDEITGVGWWASDRNRIPGKVTIYLFVPQELRQNVALDAPDLRERALLTSIRATWQEGADYSELRRAVAEVKPAKQKGETFLFVMPDGRSITGYEQLHSPRARKALQQWLQACADDAAMRSRLDGLRVQLTRANASKRGPASAAKLAAEISQLEAALDDSRANILALSNDIISLETE